MSEMVERVAEAIRAVNADTVGLSYTELTRAMACAAIEAMRKPTDMMAAVYHYAEPEDWLEVLPEEVWDSMISLALASDQLGGENG